MPDESGLHVSPETRTSHVVWYLAKYASPREYFFGTRHFELGTEWAKRGHKVAVFASNASHLTNALPTFKGRSKIEHIRGVTAVWIQGLGYQRSDGWKRIVDWAIFEWRSFWTMRRLTERPTVVIASSLSLFSVLTGFLVARRHRARFIVEIRDIWPLSAIVLGGYSPHHPFMQLLAWIERLGYRKADHIVGTMPNLKEHVAHVSPGNEAKVVCIPQGIDPDGYSSDASPPTVIMDALRSSGSFRIAYAGTINANNPLNALVECGRLLREHDVHVIILGAGSKREELESIAQGLDNVHFFDPIPKPQVARFLQEVDVCYDSFSSALGRYGLSRNKWIDYMMAERPIICSFDGYRSMINEADAGRFVPFNDPGALAAEVLQLKSMAVSEREEMGRRARRYILENRSFDTLANKYERLFGS